MDESVVIRITGKYIDEVDAGIKKSLGGLQSVTKWATVIAGTATAAGGAIFALTKKAAEMGDTFDKMAGRVGASTEFLSGMAHAAELGGASINEVEIGMRRMARTASDADNGLATATRSFEQLGITVTDNSGQLKSSEALFWEITEALGGIESETKKAALAQELFGRSGTQLLPMLNQGADAIRAQMAEAERLGIVYTEAAAKQSADFIDAQTRMQSALKGVTNVLGAELMPVFTDWMNRFAAWAGEEQNVQRLRDIAGGFKLVGDIIGGVVTVYQTLVNVAAWGFQQLFEGVDRLQRQWRAFTDFIGTAWDATIGKLISGAQKVWQWLNPFATHSPSMVQNWSAGIAQMQAQYMQFANMVNSTRLQPALAGGAPGGMATPRASGGHGLTASRGGTTTHNYTFNVSSGDGGYRRADSMRSARDLANEFVRMKRSGVI